MGRKKRHVKAITDLHNRLNYLLRYGTTEEKELINTKLFELIPNETNVAVIMVWLRVTLPYKKEYSGRKTLYFRAEKLYGDVIKALQ